MANDKLVDFYKASSTHSWLRPDKVGKELYVSAITRLERVKKARDRFSEACGEHGALIKATHEQECPSCPWNGYTIFTFNLGKFLTKD